MKDTRFHHEGGFHVKVPLQDHASLYKTSLLAAWGLAPLKNMIIAT